MRISLTVRSGIALTFLSFVMQETHELAHTSVARVICSCWGARDFNFWTLCEGCSSSHPESILATYAGPVYSFSVIWIGFFFLCRSSAKLKSIGLALIVSSMPFSRILTPLFGSGDEVFALTRQLGNHSLAWGLGLIGVLILAIPPVVKLWRTIQGKNRIGWFLGLIFVPFFATGAVVFGFLQTLLLGNGILSDYWIMGSPMIVTFWFLFSLLVLVVTGNSLQTLLQPASASDQKRALTTSRQPTEHPEG